MSAPVRVTATILAPPERVFLAFVDVGDLLSWFADGAVVGRRVGGNWALGWYADPESDAGYHALGVFETFEPGRSLVVKDLVFISPEGTELGPMRLTVRLEPGPAEGTVVTVEQDGVRDEPAWDEYRAGVGPGWERALESLRGWLEEGRKLPGR